jgi:hypothetical protein
MLQEIELEDDLTLLLYIFSAKYLDIRLKEDFSELEEEKQVIVNKVQSNMYNYYLKAHNTSEIVKVAQALPFQDASVKEKEKNL